VYTCLFLILGASLLIRFWYLDSGLSAGRFWDERFSFANVQQLFETGGLKPHNGYYPLFSYLPQGLLLYASDALHQATGAQWLAVHDGARFTANAYFLSRLVQAIWGVGTVWLTFLIGRRLFSGAVGLVAATVVAFSPGLIHAAGVFKPDAPLVLTILLAFYLSLAAARQPTTGRYAVAGGGIALAMSTKLTGGLAALPLVFVTALRCRQEPHRIARLALAGGVALGLFLLLNPYWPLYFDFLEKLTAEYRWKASGRGLTRWHAPLLIGQFLVQNLGVFGAGVAAVAILALVTLLVRRRFDSQTAAGVAMLLFFPLAYASAYVAKTAQFKPNNFLPILPFVVLALAWGLVEVGRWLARTKPSWIGRPVLLAICVVAVAVAFVPRGVNATYRLLTPSAEDLVLKFFSRRLHDHPNCQLIYERGAVRWPGWEHASLPKTCLLRPVDRLTDLEPAAIRLTDGVLFPQQRLAGSIAGRYLETVAATGEQNTVVIRPQGLSVRGPGFVMALHPWRLVAPQQVLDLRSRDQGKFRLQASMPAEVEAGDVVSFSVWMPLWALQDLPSPQLRMGGHVVDLMLAQGDRGRGATFVSPRLVSRQPAPHARLNRRRPSRQNDEIRLTLWRWRQHAARHPSTDQLPEAIGN
jgi:hypothetical protein